MDSGRPLNDEDFINLTFISSLNQNDRQSLKLDKNNNLITAFSILREINNVFYDCQLTCAVNDGIPLIPTKPLGEFPLRGKEERLKENA